MRLLTGLSILQTLCIAYLLVQVSHASAPAPASDGTPIERSVFSAPPSAAPGYDEASLRRIIREELAAAGVRGGTDPGAVDARPVDPAEARVARESVQKQIDYYRGTGAIGQQDMEQLMSRIARLDPDSRKQMMVALTQAMNSQQIRPAR